MAKLGPYQVHVRNLPAQHSVVVPATDVDAWLRGLPMRDALGLPAGDPDAGGGKAETELLMDDTHVSLTGHFKGDLKVACSRCVEPVTLVIDEPLHVTFLLAKDMPADEDDEDAEDGAEVGADDLDVFPYDGEIVDLEPLIREQFVLAVPYAPLCKEDCKGLCPQCGIDRNSGTCSCEPPGDPRLAALKGLKLPS